MNGIAMIGLNTTGNPNIIGSFMLNNPGIIDSFPSSLYCLDLEKYSIVQTNPRVKPEPPKVMNWSINWLLLLQHFVQLLILLQS